MYTHGRNTKPSTAGQLLSNKSTRPPQIKDKSVAFIAALVAIQPILIAGAVVTA